MSTPEIDELASSTPEASDINPPVRDDSVLLDINKWEEEEIKPLPKKKKVEEYCLWDWPEGRKPSYLDDTWSKWSLHGAFMFSLLFSSHSEHFHIAYQPRLAISVSLPCPQS